MKTLTARFVAGAAVVVSVYLLLQLALLCEEIHTRHRADALLAAIKTFKVGMTTLAEAEQAMSVQPTSAAIYSGACPKVDTELDYFAAHRNFNRLVYSHPILVYLGMRASEAVATLSFQNGRLCDLSFSFSTFNLASRYSVHLSPQNSEPLIMFLAHTHVHAPDSGDPLRIIPGGGLLRLMPGISSSVSVDVSQDAPPDALRDALTYNFACISTLLGCRSRCQVMPLAVHDFAVQQLANGQPDFKEAEFPLCRKAYEDAIRR